MQSKHGFLNAVILNKLFMDHNHTTRRILALVNALVLYWQKTFANASFVEMLPI